MHKGCTPLTYTSSSYKLAGSGGKLQRCFKRGILLVLCALVFTHTFSQDTTAHAAKKKKKYEADPVMIICANYNGQFPFGNIKERFGFNSLFSLELLYKTKNNWLFGANGGFIYGSNVKQNYVLDNLENPNGLFVTQYNDLTGVRLQEQGFNVQATFGKIIPVSRKFPNSGVLLLTGFGMLQHKIAINVRAAELPQLSPEYKQGYDRLTNGPVISQFAGYTFMARRKYFCGYAGLQFDAGFTADRRPYDFYLMAPLKSQGVDMFLGLKIGYMIPVFLLTSEKEYYYY
jgi:hypothetical protein